MPPDVGCLYTITESLRAVKLRTLVDNNGPPAIAEIPCGSTVEVRGPSEIPGMTSVAWQREIYALFPQDLVTRARKVA